MKRLICRLLLLLYTTAGAESLPDQALGFFEAAGVPTQGVVFMGNELVVTLGSGGTAALLVHGDFDIFDLSWKFTGAEDEEVAAYLDHALSLLAGLEERIPADTENLSAAQKLRVDSQLALVTNGLLHLESTGEQGLRILLGKLAAHDDSDLNSLRARLASRLLGEMGNSSVDPAEGCAWYDALMLSVQEDAGAE